MLEICIFEKSICSVEQTDVRDRLPVGYLRNSYVVYNKLMFYFVLDLPRLEEWWLSNRSYIWCRHTVWTKSCTAIGWRRKRRGIFSVLYLLLILPIRINYTNINWNWIGLNNKICCMDLSTVVLNWSNSHQEKCD